MAELGDSTACIADSKFGMVQYLAFQTSNTNNMPDGIFMHVLMPGPVSPIYMTAGNAAE